MSVSAIRPSIARLSARTAALAKSSSSSTANNTTTSTASSAVRAFSTTKATKAADHGHDEHGHHEEPYDPPAGWLFGEKPGEKYQKEGWEGIFMWGFCGSLVLGAVGYAFKPDTSIQTWALEEARRRLEAEGILEDPETKPKS